MVIPIPVKKKDAKTSQRVAYSFLVYFPNRKKPANVTGKNRKINSTELNNNENAPLQHINYRYKPPCNIRYIQPLQLICSVNYILSLKYSNKIILSGDGLRIRLSEN